MSRLVDHADGLRVRVVARDKSPRVGGHAVFVPRIAGQKLLQRPRLHVRRQGDRFDALARQLAQLPANVGLQLRARFRATKTIGELTQKPSQLRPQTQDLIRGHP
jgi:hypothetical protein